MTSFGLKRGMEFGGCRLFDTLSKHNCMLCRYTDHVMIYEGSYYRYDLMMTVYTCKKCHDDLMMTVYTCKKCHGIFDNSKAVKIKFKCVKELE